MLQRKANSAIRWILISAAIVAAGAIGVGILWLNRPRVTITYIVDGPVVDAFYATGIVEPETEYPIKTSNAGIVTDVFFDKGDAVHVGDRLAVIEDPQLQYKLDKATADLQQATKRADDKNSPVLQEYDAKLQANAAMLDNANNELKDYIQLRQLENNKKAVSQSDLDKAADHVQDLTSQGASLAAQRAAAKLQLGTDLAIAKAARDAAKIDVDRQTLTSPIDGVVLDRPTPRNTRLNVNDHVMQLARVQPEYLRMRGAVDEENVAQVETGQLVQMVLYSFPGRSFEGAVTQVYPKADADRRTFEVDIKFKAPDKNLKTGMTGELAFINEKKDRAMIAPAQAVQGGAIYTVRNGCLVRVDNADIGIKSVERIELLSGLKIGDPIVISSIQDIRIGSPVRTTVIDPATAAGLNKPSSNANQKNPMADH